ncbi:glycosyltransferase BC10-like [Tripterygium wilfordii]|nr:glycosyltransferase BC10-like [Tripterygium wilfordii]
MSKKAPPPFLRRHVVWRILFALTVTVAVFSLLRLQFQPDISSTESIARARYRVAARDIFTGRPKVAFLFLVRRELPLDFLWGSFFENADVEDFSIYIHSTPGFLFDESTTRSHFFYGRQLKNSIKVAWGESSMIQAEKLLFTAALEDPANQRFVLLSDSCVPLYNFSYIYHYLMGSPRSFVDSFLDAKEGRYNPKMSPVIPKNKWRKGSQWITLIRSYAEVIADDEIIFPVFRKFCKRRPPLDAKLGKLNLKLQKQHDCIPDEHYMQTLLAMLDLEGQLERRTLTYTQWNQSAAKMNDKSWHPMAFSYANAGPRQIKRIKDINHIYYETEGRTEWCRSNLTSVPCFLFARKFSRGAAMRLLSDGVFGPFDASALLTDSFHPR